MKKDLVTFGLIWASIFLIIGVYPLYVNEKLRIEAIGIAVMFLLIIGIYPNFFKPFYHVWLKLGTYTSSVTSKLILFILFFGLFTPISFILKLLKKDLLSKKIDKNATSYWIIRKTQPQSMKNRF